MATEKRLIDANALEKDMFETADICKTDHLFIDVITYAIENAPTVDAVEVVRCKDCKHYMTIHCICDGCCISNDWYCADGERRTTDVQ